MIAVEAGMRYGSPGPDRFDAAISLVYTRWTDIQADIFHLGLPVTANIGNGRIYTLDLRLGWRPVPRLAFEISGIFNESAVTELRSELIAAGVAIDPSAPPPNVARVNGRFAIDYHARLSGRHDLRVSTVVRYVGKSRLGVGDAFDEEQGNWLDVSLGGRIETSRHAFTLALTNLLDSVGNRFALGSPFTFRERRQITPLRPRALRLGWEVRF